MTHKIPTLQLITRMIIGGAQETAMLIADMLDPEQFTVDLLTGPQTGPEGSLLEETRRRGISLIIDNALVREIHPAKDLIAFVQLYRHIRRNRYEIVHTNSSKAGILGRLAAWLAGTPIIVHTVHGWGHNDYQRPLVRDFYIALEKFNLRITDQLIAVSALDIDKGVADGIGQPADYVVIRSGVEMDRFGHPQVPPEKTRQALKIPLDAPIVGTVTRMSPQKAPLDYIQAMAIVAKSEPRAYFVMVGDGPLRPDVEALASELGIADRLVLTGLRRDVPELMAMFDIFVLSSLWEGLPRVLPQAMATGLPVVATAIDGNAEIITDGMTGRLVPPGTPPAIAQAVIELLQDKQLATTLGQAGKEKSDEFSARKMVDDIEQLYKHLLRQKEIR
jgi:glycosyltransferase involved in cell wall biosynthesis